MPGWNLATGLSVCPADAIPAVSDVSARFELLGMGRTCESQFDGWAVRGLSNGYSCGGSGDGTYSDWRPSAVPEWMASGDLRLADY